MSFRIAYNVLYFMGQIPRLPGLLTWSRQAVQNILIHQYSTVWLIQQHPRTCKAGTGCQMRSAAG